MSLKLIGAVLVVLLVGWFMLNQAESTEPFTQATLPGGELRAYMARRVNIDDHPCVARSRCLVVYLAPWCGACKSTKKFVPYVRDMLEQDPETGFMVVVGKGWGNFNGGHDMARDIGGQVYLDDEANYWRALRHEVNAVPAWVVFDGLGEAIETETGSPRRHSHEVAKSFLADLGV